MRYWPAGGRCPHQGLVLLELLRFVLDTEKISATPGKDDTVTTNEKICMTPANSMNEKTCMSASMNEVKSMAHCKNDTRPSKDKNAEVKPHESKNAEPTNHEFKNIAPTVTTDKIVPTYVMKRYRFRKTFQPTTVYVSWIVNKLCADNVYHHMQRYGPCTFEDWDVQSLGKKAWNTATIEFTDSQDAQRALSAKHVEIENDDKQMVPAEFSWQLSAETSLL